MTITDGHDVATPNHPTGPTRGQIGRALFNTLMSAAGFAVCVVGPATTWTAARPWVMVGVFLLMHVFGTIRIVRASPDLLRERARVGRHPGQPIADKVLLLAFVASYAGLIIVSSADASRWHIWPAPALAVSWAGLAIFAAGWWLALRALQTNAFAVRVVRHQPERGHRVIDIGVYRVVRHPMYSGLLAVMIGAPLWLGSTLGLLLAAAPIGILVLRIVVEEKVLRVHVPGYAQYTQRVPRRLIPRVW
jgi:protein-S-isoprenylcysteine O-methyltransferase Ste14